MKTTILCALGMGLTALAMLAPASAASEKPADYPKRPINLVVSYPAGGGLDITARVLAAEMERITGHQFRVENRTGGGGMIGNTYVAKQAKPDGYTIGILSTPALFIHILKQGAHFKKEDLEPIAGISFTPVSWYARSDSEFGKMKFEEVIDYAKANPGKLKVGIIPGNTFEMATDIVASQTGAEFNYVPYQGGKDAVVGLLGGNVDISAAYYAEVAQYVEEGTLTPLAVADNVPSAEILDAPTMKDLNIEMASSTWGADRLAFVPKGTSPEIKEYLASIIAETLADEAAIAAFKKVGINVNAKTLAEQQAAYDEGYAAVEDYLRSIGELNAN